MLNQVPQDKNNMSINRLGNSDSGLNNNRKSNSIELKNTALHKTNEFQEPLLARVSVSPQYYYPILLIVPLYLGY